MVIAASDNKNSTSRRPERTDQLETVHGAKVEVQEDEVR